ncbi:MAG: carbohydrate ABC transporter permease [Treponema sp.]|jgi:raffinose/stachyose/melibiose transport system permease protein|nr:carbohydrate ABC transporter permease [Treponema sp.]
MIAGKSRTRYLFLYLVTGFFALFYAAISLLPFYSMALTSLKTQNDYAVNGFFSLPQVYVFSNYRTVIKDGIFNYFKNSVILVVVSLTLLLVISMLVSYPLSRFYFRLRKPMMSFFVASLAIPMHVTLIPIYLLTRTLGIYDTYPALIIPYIAFNIPITVFILVNFMKTIPRELEDAAEIDGCGKVGIFSNVIVPLSGAGVVTVGIYNAINMWNEFTFALVLTQSAAMRTLPMAVWNYKGQYSGTVPLIFCVLLLSVVPMIIAYAVGQDKLVQGMMAGALKG